MIKNILSVLIILMCFSSLAGQVNKFRTTQGAIKMLQDDGVWGEWTEWKDSNLLITLNNEIDRITIYDDPKRTFDIISKEEENKEGYKSLLLNCIGAYEDEILFKMTYRDGSKLQFYIYYEGFIIVYNTISLD